MKFNVLKTDFEAVIAFRLSRYIHLTGLWRQIAAFAARIPMTFSMKKQRPRRSGGRSENFVGAGLAGDEARRYDVAAWADAIAGKAGSHSDRANS